MMKGKRLVRLPFFMKLAGRREGGIVIFFLYRAVMSVFSCF